MRRRMAGEAFSAFEATEPHMVGKEHTLRLLSGAYQDFTDKGLRWLHNQGGNN